jgi:DNA repair protein RadC
MFHLIPFVTNANTSFNAYQVTEIQLTYKTSVRSSERPKITCSEDAYKILLENWNDKTIELCEEFKILLLNRANKVLGIVNISSGGVSGTVADPKIIFSSALKANCSSLILVHNHPSGNLQPSQADLKLTNNLVQAGKYLEIPVLDHLIISSESYFSMSDEGIIH